MYRSKWAALPGVVVLNSNTTFIAASARTLAGNGRDAAAVAAQEQSESSAMCATGREVVVDIAIIPEGPHIPATVIVDIERLTATAGLRSCFLQSQYPDGVGGGLHGGKLDWVSSVLSLEGFRGFVLSFVFS